MSYAATIYLVILGLSLIGIYRHDGELVKRNFAHHALLACVIPRKLCDLIGWVVRLIGRVLL